MKKPINPLKLIYTIGFAAILIGIYLTDDYFTTGAGLISISAGANIMLWGNLLLSRKDKASERASILRAQKAELEMLFADDSN